MVTESPSEFVASASSSLPPGAAPQSHEAAPGAAPSISRGRSFMRWLAGCLMVLACLMSVGLAWRAQRQVSVLEKELVSRQDTSQQTATEAQVLAKQANATVQESLSKVAVLESRVAEVAMQRSQLEELVQSLSRSRDENVVIDIEAAIRVALQQTAITGSAEPLVAVLKQSEERLARDTNLPRLQGIRRAILRDLDRVRAVGITDVGALTGRLDEAVRLVDELPLLSARRGPQDEMGSPSAATSHGTTPVSAPAASVPASAADPRAAWWDAGASMGRHIWGEVRSLVRVSRIDHPDAVLLAPEQAFFLRENLKLRLLNARLALLSRQFDTAQADLKAVQDAVQRYFDPQSRRTGHAIEVVRQVAAQARAVPVPRPDDTLAALAAVEAGR